MTTRAVQPCPWIGTAYRHIPAGDDRNILDFRHAGRQPDNRWNDAGEPTLYLAGDPGIMIAEWGRHFPLVFDEHARPATVERSVHRLSLRLQRVADLRDADLLPSATTSPPFLDRDVTRSLARSLRAAGSVEGLIVPSIAFLDDLTRWNLVVFLDTLPGHMPTGASSWITRTEYVGPLRWR
jgi:RES domain-containing protein